MKMQTDKKRGHDKQLLSKSQKTQEKERQAELKNMSTKTHMQRHIKKV
jgi:hypothetical protein